MEHKRYGFLLLALSLFLVTCGSTPRPEKTRAESDAAPVVSQTAQPQTGEAQAEKVNPFYTGEGGQGMSLAILAPKATGLTEKQGHIPVLVQGELVSSFSGYSAISVLDRVQLDNQYAELFSGYYDDNAEKGMDLGHLTPTDYIMGGSITKTAAGYALQIQITKTADKMTAASYSGTCTFAELDNLTGARRAALDLLQKMGVELTARAKTELAGAAAANHVNAQTALAQGITAQKSGTVVEALSYYYQAESFDPALLEAASRAGTMSAEISSGNIGENVRNDIQRRKEWQKLLTEAEDYFGKHLPYEIVYDPTLTQGKVDYARETVDLSFNLEVRPTDGFKTINTILTGLEATGKQEEWGMNFWPLSSSVFVDEITHRDKNWGVVHSGEDMNNRSPLKKIAVTVQLVNTTTGKVIATADEYLFRIPLRFRNFRWVDRPGGPIGFGEYKWDMSVLAETTANKIVFPNVNANNITDNMTVKIVSVNDVDAETIGKTGYIRISTGVTKLERERLAEEREREAQERQAQKRREQERQEEAERVLASDKAASIRSRLTGFYHKLNNKEFDEFMATCREWRAFVSSNKYVSDMDDGNVRSMVVSIVRGILSSAQKKKYSAEFGGR